MANLLTLADLARLEGMHQAATPGEWHHDPRFLYGCCTSAPGGRGRIICTMGREGTPGDKDREDAALIAASRNALPVLIEMARECIRLRRGLEHIAQTCIDDPDTAQFACRFLDGSAEIPPEES